MTGNAGQLRQLLSSQSWEPGSLPQAWVWGLSKHPPEAESVLCSSESVSRVAHASFSSQLLLSLRSLCRQAQYWHFLPGSSIGGFEKDKLTLSIVYYRPKGAHQECAPAHSDQDACSLSL